MPDRVQRLWLYERGCVVHQEPEHTLEAFRWSSLHVRRRSVLRSDGGWATSWCRIAHDGGSVVEFASQSTMFPEVEVLTERLVAHITAARWPAAHAAFDAGQRLDFGAVALDRDHLHGPAGALPWREIEKLVVEEGQVRVKAAGRRRWWLNVSTAEVDDLENVLRLAPRT